MDYALTGGPARPTTCWVSQSATTVHKAQGSEYPAVVIPVTIQHYPMLQRNLLYTAVTRGRQLVVLVAQPKAVAIVRLEDRGVGTTLPVKALSVPHTASQEPRPGRNGNVGVDAFRE